MSTRFAMKGGLRPTKPIGMFGAILLTAGVVAIGVSALDLHGHTCKCGSKWRHLGAFNFGEHGSHQCQNCGEVQWVRDQPWYEKFQRPVVETEPLVTNEAPPPKALAPRKYEP